MDRWSVGADSENLDIQKKKKKKKLCQSTNQTRQKFSPTLDCDSITVIFTKVEVIHKLQGHVNAVWHILKRRFQGPSAWKTI